MTQYTFIHSHENLAIFGMPPIYVAVALQGYNLLRACFRHLGTTKEKKSSSSLLCLFNITFEFNLL